MTVNLYWDGGVEQPVSVIYTLVGREQLFADLPPQQVPVRELKMGPRTLLLTQASDGTVRINQLLSTDPADYLQPQWQPGVDWQPSADPAH